MNEHQEQPAPPWLEAAFSQHGVHEISGPKAHRQIQAYHSTTALRATSDEVPWCSAFVNWCMVQARQRGTGSAAARSWLEWGEPLQRPRLGCVVILQSSRGPNAGHVGLYWMQRNASQIWLYGGNQDNAVGVKAYPRIDIIGLRWPTLYGIAP